MYHKATIIIKSNAIFTGLTNSPIEGALVIYRNRIVDIVQKQEAALFQGDETVVYDVGDSLVTPGFHDFHLHLLMGSLLEKAVDLTNATSETEAAQLVEQFVVQHPDSETVLGLGWDYHCWSEPIPPHRYSLDAVVHDRPVMLYHSELHGAWLNSKALEVCGISKETPDPPYGKIVRDESGLPTGFLIENAVGLATKLLHPPQAQLKKLAKQFFKKANALGITSVHDLLRLPEMSIEEIHLYHTLAREESLPIRIHVVAPLNGDVTLANTLREHFQHSKVRFVGFKQFIDGVISTRTAYMLQPYENSDTKGDTVFSREELIRWTTEAHRHGHRVRFHAIGDGAVQLALDAFEEAQNVSPNNRIRHTIEHIETIDEKDIHRIQKLNVIASIQPEHLNLSQQEAYIRQIGDERFKRTFPTNTILKSGAHLAFGSDYPVADLNPLRGIYRAVTRYTDWNEQWHPHERISLADALRGYTEGPAYGSYREHELGKLQPGMLADIVVLDRNLFAVSHEEILEATPLLTICNGDVTFQSESIVPPHCRLKQI